MTKATVVQLADLTVNEGSLVDKGDNPEAHVMLAKRAQEPTPEGFFAFVKRWVDTKVLRKDGYGEEAPPQTTAQVLAMDEFHAKFCALKMAFMASVQSILDADPSPATPELLKRSVQEFADAAGALIGGDLAPAVKALVDAAPTATHDRQTFASALKALDQFTPAIKAVHAGTPGRETSKMDMPAPGMTPEEEAKKKAEEEAAAKAAAEATAKSAAQVEVEKAEVVALRKRVQDAEEALAKAKDEQATQAFVTKAQAMGLAGVEVTKLGNILKRANAVSADFASDLEGVLKALSAQVKANDQITKTVGTVHVDAAEGGAEGRIEKAAAALRMANPKLTKEAAYTAVLKADPSLYTETLKEHAATR